MSTRFPKYGVVLFFVALIATAACDGATITATGPSPMFQTGDVRSSLAVEPLSLRPEFIDGHACGLRPPFGTRLSFVIRGGQDVIVRGLRFWFIDRRGIKAFPDVIPMPTFSTTIPPLGFTTTPAVPFPGFATLPGASAIPIPGSSPVQGIFVSAGAPRVLPYYLRFGCDLFADGNIVVIVDAGDRFGRFSFSELRIRVGL